MRMKEEQTIDTSEYKYTLLVPDGEYVANSLFSLLWELFKHRCWHLWKHKRWMD